MNSKTVSGQVKQESVQRAIHQLMRKIIVHTQGAEESQLVGVEHASIQNGEVIFHLLWRNGRVFKARTHWLQADHNHCIAVGVKQIGVEKITTRKRV